MYIANCTSVLQQPHQYQYQTADQHFILMYMVQQCNRQTSKNMPLYDTTPTNSTDTYNNNNNNNSHHNMQSQPYTHQQHSTLMPTIVTSQYDAQYDASDDEDDNNGCTLTCPPFMHNDDYNNSNSDIHAQGTYNNTSNTNSIHGIRLKSRRLNSSVNNISDASVKLQQRRLIHTYTQQQQQQQHGSSNSNGGGSTVMPDIAALSVDNATSQELKYPYNTHSDSSGSSNSNNRLSSSPIRNNNRRSFKARRRSSAISNAVSDSDDISSPLLHIDIHACHSSQQITNNNDIIARQHSYINGGRKRNSRDMFDNDTNSDTETSYSHTDCTASTESDTSSSTDDSLNWRMLRNQSQFFRNCTHTLHNDDEELQSTLEHSSTAPTDINNLPELL